MRFEDNPTIGAFPGEQGQVRYGERLLIGYRWYDAHALEVAYLFGHGLSYTTFLYSGLDVTVRVDGAEPVVGVSLTVTNTGDRAGKETVQVYVTDPAATVYRPEQELRAFVKVALGAGESARVTLTLDDRAFAFWRTRAGRWVVEGGDFGIRVGTSSRDVRPEATIELSGTGLVDRLSAESTADAWLGHPVGGDWLRGSLAGSEFRDMLFDEQHGQMIRAIPLQRLSRFRGFPRDGGAGRRQGP